MEQTIQCAECRRNFIFTDKEATFLKDLVAQGKLAEFAVPRRCLGCRQRKRREAKAVAPPAPVPVPATVEYVLAPAKPAIPLSPVPASPPALSLGPDAVQWPISSVPTAPTVPPPAPVQAVVPLAPAPTAVPAKETIFEGKPPQIIRDEEIRIVLASDDFEKLVCREEVLWTMGNKKVRIILADIGFPVMKEALKKAMMQWWKS
jgi:hypothetical protein